MIIDLYINTDNLIRLAGLKDNDGGSYINDATVEMSLYQLAARKRYWLLVPNVVATAGTWTLTYLDQATAAIQYDATLGEIQAAVEALRQVAEGDIVVSGQTLDAGTNGVSIEFAESFRNVNAITFDFDTNLTGPTNDLSTIMKNTKHLFTGAVVDKGGGDVGIPVVNHDAVAAGRIKIEGTKKYNGEYTVVSVTADEIVVTATYVAETMRGFETLYVGLVNGTEISLVYDGDATGGYDAILPYDVEGLIENQMINTSRQPIEIGVYWLFVRSLKAGNYRTDKIECKAKYPSGA